MMLRLFLLSEGAVQVYLYKFNREFNIYILGNIGYFFSHGRKRKDIADITNN